MPEQKDRVPELRKRTRWQQGVLVPSATRRFGLLLCSAFARRGTRAPPGDRNVSAATPTRAVPPLSLSPLVAAPPTRPRARTQTSAAGLPQPCPYYPYSTPAAAGGVVYCTGAPSFPPPLSTGSIILATDNGGGMGGERKGQAWPSCCSLIPSRMHLPPGASHCPLLRLSLSCPAVLRYG